MELPGSGYLYTLATLAMTFVGFCAVVFVLRQGRPRKHAGFHVLHSHGYIEIALGSVAAAMLPPLLAVCGVPTLAIWQWSSAVVAAGYSAHTWYILARFYRITGWRFPIHLWFNCIVTGIVIAFLVANTVGYPIKPDVGPIAVAATWRLVMAIEVFFLTLEEFL